MERYFTLIIGLSLILVCLCVIIKFLICKCIKAKKEFIDKLEVKNGNESTFRNNDITKNGCSYN